MRIQHEASGRGGRNGEEGRMQRATSGDALYILHADERVCRSKQPERGAYEGERRGCEYAAWGGRRGEVGKTGMTKIVIYKKKRQNIFWRFLIIV